MRKITIEEKWHQQSEAAKNAAQNLPHGRERDALIKRRASYKPPLKSINGFPRQN
jgi:hypothetical protein